MKKNYEYQSKQNNLIKCSSMHRPFMPSWLNSASFIKNIDRKTCNSKNCVFIS